MELLEIKNTGVYGKSIYARKNFERDETVFVVKGKLIDYPTTFTIPIDDNKYINPEQEGNVAQYLCHSCNPSCGIKDRIKVVAMKPILKDEEITIDYAMIGFEYGDELPEDERICLCGNPICRGTLGCFKTLSPELKEKYKGYISHYLIK